MGLTCRSSVKSGGQYPGDTIALEDVTISVLPFQEKYMEATGGVFVIEADKIRNSNSFHTSDLFNMAPGVHMASVSLNTNRVVIRGVGSRTPYNSNRIRAYLDDIPLTSGDGISTLEDLDMFSIGSMEVLKGPASALYGSGLGGVIRLNSPYPDQNGFRTTVSAEGGSFNTTRYGITTAYKKKSLALTGGLTRSSTNGYRENSNYQRTNAFVNAQYFGEKHSVSLTMSLVDLYSGIPSSLNETDFINDPSLAGGSWGAIKGFEEYVRRSAIQFGQLEAEKVVFLGDGAKSNWEIQRTNFPGAIGILDFYHATEHLALAARLLHGEGPPAMQYIYRQEQTILGGRFDELRQCARN